MGWANGVDTDEEEGEKDYQAGDPGNEEVEKDPEAEVEVAYDNGEK